MLSFIIIGRNEGWKLSQCFESVLKTIDINNISDFEVIYIDSNSSDASIERAKQCKGAIKIFQLTGDYNAAIARNIGAEESKGDVLFFMDGDMELIPENFSAFYTEEIGLEFPFLSGNWDNYFYTQEWNFIKKDHGLGLKENLKTSTVGGLFFIEKNLWNSTGGMRVEFKRSQDIDFALRLAKRGNLLLRKKELLVHHHMIAYLDKTRKWKLLFSGADLYGRSYLYRRNIFNKYCLKRIIRNDYSCLVLFTGIILSIVLSSILPLVAFPIILLPKTIRKNEKYFDNYIYFIIRDVIVLLGCFIFWPKKLKYIQYHSL